MEFEILNPLCNSKWDELLISSDDYSFFHTLNWARVLTESYKYKPKYFTIISNNRLQALIPFMEINSILTGKRGVSLPFSDYSDSIISDCYNPDDIFKDVIQYGRDNGWKSFEIRGGNISFSNLYPSSYYYSHTLTLSNDTDKIFSTFRDSTKRNIKKAEKEGVTINICNSMESVNEYYRLNCMTRKEHGLPPQPYSFFSKVYEHVISKKLGIVVLADYEKQVIAGAIYFHFGDKAIYKYGASDKKHQNLRANNLIMWEAIRWYSQNGFKEFCFGRTEPDHDGLLQFKRGWGGEEGIIKYVKFDLIKGEYVIDSSKTTGLHNKIFNKMPIPLLRRIGMVLYKHIG